MRISPSNMCLGTGLVILPLTLMVAAMLSPRFANTEERAETNPVQPQRMLVEIYRIAPGKHEAFLRDIASYDEANEMAGLPPRQLYVHSDGASWDFMLIQPAKTPEDRADALSRAWEELDLPSGTQFFLKFRENIAEHSDTFAHGPTNAADVLASIKR